MTDKDRLEEILRCYNVLLANPDNSPRNWSRLFQEMFHAGQEWNKRYATTV